MALRDMPAVAYHVYYTILPIDMPDGSRVELAMQGPLRDGAGAPVRIPLDVDVAGLPLEPGKYRLVPVDASDRTVNAVEPIEIVIPASDIDGDPRMVALEVTKRALMRITTNPEVLARANEPLNPDLRLLLRAHGQAHLEGARHFEAVMEARTTEEREHALELAAADLAQTLAQIVISGGRVPGDHPVPLTQTSIHTLMRAPLRCSVDAIRAAARRLDYGDAVARALARISVGVPFPAEELVEILPGIGSAWLVFSMVSLASGDRADAALASVRDRVFPDSIVDNSARACALYAAWEVGDPDTIRPLLVPLTRRVARGRLTDETRALMCVLADQLGDPGLCAIIDHIGRPSEEVRRIATARAERAMRASIEDVIAAIVPDETAPPTQPAELTGDSVWALPLDELRNRRLPETPEILPAMTHRFARSDNWRQAKACALHASALGVQPYADMCHGTLAEHAVQAGLVTLADEHVAQLEDPNRISPGARIALALACGDSDALQLIAEHAGDLLDPLTAEMFALALLGVVPPLGLLVARGCIERNGQNVDRIVEAVERVRDSAGLPPFDRAWHLRERLRAEEQRDAALADNARLRDELASADARLLAELKRAAAAEGALAHLRIEYQQLLAQPIEPEERRALRQRIDDLEEMIREGNTERAALRRTVASYESGAQTGRLRAEPREEVDDIDDDTEAVPAPSRRVLIPEVGRAVRDALHSVPPHVSAEAIRTLGHLAAGDVAAWHGVKQAKGTAVPIYLARIGIHHRLLFQIDDRVLCAVDLVAREELLAVIKRLRVTRGSRARP